MLEVIEQKNVEVTSTYMISDFKTMLMVKANFSVKVNGSEMAWNLFLHIYELHRGYEGFCVCVIQFAVKQYMERIFMIQFTVAGWIVYDVLICEICLEICMT